MTQTARTPVFSEHSRVAQLRRKHMALKEKIAEELKRPAPCSVMLQQLKRKRLKLKDEMSRQMGVIRAFGTSPRMA